MYFLWMFMFKIECLKSLVLIINLFGVPFNSMWMFFKKYLHAYRQKIPSIKLVLALLRVSQMIHFCFLSFVHSFFFFFFPPFLSLHTWHSEVPRLRVESELQLPAYATGTEMPDARSESRICDLHQSLWQCQILKPLSKARGRTRILRDAMLGS